MKQMKQMHHTKIGSLRTQPPCSSNPQYPMRIALLLESDGPGGAEKMVFHLAEGLLAREHTVLPVGPERGVGWLGALYREELGIEPSYFQLRRMLDPVCVADSMSMYCRERVDGVHYHEYSLASYTTVAERFSGLQSIIILHSAAAFLNSGRTRTAIRWAIRTADFATTIFVATRDAIVDGLGSRGSSLQMIPNEVPIPEGDGRLVRSELGVGEPSHWSSPWGTSG